MAYVPPWLSVTPQSFAESYANGVRAGLSAAAQRQQAAQAAARMEQVAAEERRREWETQQRLALDQQGLAQRRELGLENLRAQQAWRNASMGIDRERLAETGRHNLAMEAPKDMALTPFQKEQIKNWEINRGLREKGSGTSAATASGILQNWSDVSEVVKDPQEQLDLKIGAQNVIRKNSGLPLLPRQVISNVTNQVPKVGILNSIAGLPGLSKPSTNLVDEISTVTNTVPWPSGGLSSETPSSNRVRVKSPDGKIGTISESNLQEALDAGYTRL